MEGGGRRARTCLTSLPGLGVLPTRPTPAADLCVPGARGQQVLLGADDGPEQGRCARRTWALTAGELGVPAAMQPWSSCDFYF